MSIYKVIMVLGALAGIAGTAVAYFPELATPSKHKEDCDKYILRIIEENPDLPQERVTKIKRDCENKRR